MQRQTVCKEDGDHAEESVENSIVLTTQKELDGSIRKIERCSFLRSYRHGTIQSAITSKIGL